MKLHRERLDYSSETQYYDRETMEKNHWDNLCNDILVPSKHYKPRVWEMIVALV